MCHFRVLADTETIAEIGADLRLYNTDQGPHQDPNVGNFEPPQGTNQTCDSYLSGINGGNSINHEKSFIRWGVQAPYVVNAIWIINPGQEWPPQSDSVALQVAFVNTGKSVLNGTFYLINSDANYWGLSVTCDPNYVSTTTVTTTVAPDLSTTLPAGGSNGGSTAGIVVGIILLLVGVVVLFLVARHFYRRNLVTSDIDAFEPEIQEDFLGETFLFLNSIALSSLSHRAFFSSFM